MKSSQPGSYFKDSCSSTSITSNATVVELSATKFAGLLSTSHQASNGTWSQTVCTGTSCTEEASCHVETYQQGACVPVEGGGSAIGECWACGVRLSIWAADNCPGEPSEVMTEPVGQCAPQRSGGVAMNSCDSGIIKLEGALARPISLAGLRTIV